MNAYRAKVLALAGDTYALGGEGSGNFGHGGRPGEVGGSGPGAPLTEDEHSFVKQWTDTAYITDEQRERMAALVRETRRGGRLEAFRPANGTVLYRAQHGDADEVNTGTVSFSTDPKYVKGMFGDTLFTIRVKPGMLALDLGKLGVKHAERENEVVVSVSRMGRHRARLVRDDDDDEQDLSFDMPYRVRMYGYQSVDLGGQGSGNFGHSGRPGEVGGSAGDGHVVFHGTSEQSLSGILKDGLKASHSGKVWPTESQRDHVYVATDEDTALEWASYAAQQAAIAGAEHPGARARAAQGPPPPVVILKIRVPADQRDRVTRDAHQVGGTPTNQQFKGDIPREWIIGAKIGRPSKSDATVWDVEYAWEDVHLRAEAGQILYVVLVGKSPTVHLGGAGSGNFGHSGRPGEVGGSGPGDESVAMQVAIEQAAGGRPTGDGEATAQWEAEFAEQLAKAQAKVKEQQAAGEKEWKKPDGGTVRLTVPQVIPPEVTHKIFGDGEELATIAEQMLSEMPGDVEVKFRTSYVDENGLTRATSTDKHNSVRMIVDREDGLLVMRTFTRRDGRLSVYHDLFEVPKAEQGKGTAKALLAQSYELYKKLGVSHISTYAANDAGGYVWAKFGFTAENPRDLSRHLMSRLESEVKLTREGRDAVMDVLAKHRNNRRLPWHVAGIVTEDGVKVGKQILSGARWDAVLNMGDKDSTDRLEHYLADRKKKLRAAYDLVLTAHAYRVLDLVNVVRAAVHKPRVFLLGGTGSGNFGHSGRPGEVGGSGGGATKTATATGVGALPSRMARMGSEPTSEWGRSALWYDFGKATFDTPSGDVTPVTSTPLKDIAKKLSHLDHAEGGDAVAKYLDALSPPAPEGYTKIIRIASDKHPGLKGNNAANARGMLDFIYQNTDDGDYTVEYGFQLEDNPDLAVHTYHVKLPEKMDARYGGRAGGGRGNFAYGR